MSSAVHSGRAKEQIACKVFIQCIKHTAAQRVCSVPLFFAFFVVEAARKKGPGHSKQRQSRGSPSYLTRYFHRNLIQLHGRWPRKQVHTVEMTVPKPPKIFNDHRGCVPHTQALWSTYPGRISIMTAKSRSHVGGSKPHLCRYSTTRPLVCCYGSRLCTVRFVASSHIPSEQVSHMYSRSFPQ